MDPDKDRQFVDPNQSEAIQRRSACLDYRLEVSRRGGKVHLFDVRIASTLIDNLYDVLPVRNTAPKEEGEKFEEDRYEYARKVNALSELRKDNPAEYNREVWRLQELFLRRCTTFMNDTLFVRNVRTKKPLTEGGAYEPKP